MTITMSDFAFDPSTVSASTSQDIILKNTGAALHNFSIVGTDVDDDGEAGQSQSLPPPATPLAPGDYNVFCKYHKALGMVATLTVTAGT